MPPYREAATVGRLSHDLVSVYKEQSKHNLSYSVINDGIYSTAFRGLTLTEYIEARRSYCLFYHNRCTKCSKLLQIAETVLTIGFITLKQAFTTAFPTVTYTQFNAKRLLLQMPLVCLRLDYKPGKSECILIEYHDGVNYKNLLQLLSICCS